MAEKEDKKTDAEVLEAEIDEGVDAAVEDAEAIRREEAAERGEEEPEIEAEEELAAKEDKKPEKLDVKEDDSADNNKDGSGSDENKDAVTDEHLERAVKAGLSIADARKFGSASLLESMVSRLEIAQKPKTDDAGDGDGEADDPLDAFPDLDPADYDEVLVNGFKAMKDFARSQMAENKALRENGSSQSTDTWLEGSKSGLDEPVAKAVEANPAKWKDVTDKFNMLTAGYKATDQNVSREAILKEAIGTTMGDVIAKAKADEQSKKLRARSKQHLNRPSGKKGRDDGGDVFEEIGEEIDQKFDSSNKK